MPKRKLKRKFRIFLFVLLFSSMSILILLKYDYLNDMITIFKIDKEINIKNIYIEKPDIRIVDLSKNSRAIGISINNNHNCWPHAGLQEAYLAYELIAEGGITRILAFYKDSDLERIGSVRSARHYFLDYMLENDAIFVHFGHSPQALEDIKTLNIDNINGIYDSNPFFRDNTLNKAYEHTAFTKMSGIRQSIEKNNYRTTSNIILLKYSPYNINRNNDSTIKEANTVTIEYSNYTTTKYVYDSNKRVYKQFINDIEQKDALTNETYTTKNIITYQVSNTSIDSYGRQELNNIGYGEGFYITDGKSIKIKWKKESRSSKTIYTDTNNKELIVNDGNTWIHIQPLGKQLIIE